MSNRLKGRPTMPAERLADLRTYRGTNVQLAEKHHITPGHVSHLRRLHGIPSLHRSEKAAARVKAKAARLTRQTARDREGLKTRENASVMWQAGYSLGEIAADMGSSVNTVAAYIGRMRKRFPLLFPYRHNMEPKSETDAPK